MKTKRLEFTIDAPWELAIYAYDGKMYNIPNPEQPDVLDMKFFNFHWDETTDVSTLNRSSRVKFPVPGFLMRAITDEKEIKLEFQETIDRKNRRIVTLMENKNLLSVVKLTETTTFMPDPADPVNKTKMVTEARMNFLGNFWGVGKVEGIVTKVYADGITKARKQDMPAIEKARAKLKADGTAIETLLCPSEVECREYMHHQAEKEAKLREAQDDGNLDDDDDDDSDDSDDEFYDAESDEGEGADADPAAALEPVALDSDADPAAVAEAAAPAVKTKTKTPKTKSPKTKSTKATLTKATLPAKEADAGTTSGGDADVSASGLSPGASPIVPHKANKKDKKKAMQAIVKTADADAITTDSFGGGNSSEDGLLETKGDSDPEEAGKKKTRKQRMMGTFKKVGVSSLWAAGVALKATGRAAVVVKNKAAKGGAVVATAARKRGGTISKKLSKSKLKKDKRKARGSAYQASVQTPYAWRDHANTAEYETALLARRMQMETESFKASQGAASADADGRYGMPTPELQTEYDEIVAELTKVTEAKMAGGMPNLAESTDTTDTEALLGFLGETGSTPGPITPEQRLVYLGRFLNAIGVLYAEADVPAIAMAKARLAQLAAQIEQMSELSSALSPGVEEAAPPAVEQEVAATDDTDALEDWLGPEDGEADPPAGDAGPIAAEPEVAAQPEVAAVADASTAAPAPEPEVAPAPAETTKPAPVPAPELEGNGADAADDASQEGGDAAETAGLAPEEPKEETEAPKGQDFANFGGNVNITVAKKKGKKKKK